MCFSVIDAEGRFVCVSGRYSQVGALGAGKYYLADLRWRSYEKRPKVPSTGRRY